MSNLRDQLSTLAEGFAASVLAAIRSASLEDLMAEGGAAPARGRGRPRVGTKAAAASPRASAPSAGSAAGAKRQTGRLARRSPADIDRALALVVTALKATRGKGLRSEQIQQTLGLDKRELPRVLRTGISKKMLKSKGQKRATVYFAA